VLSGFAYLRRRGNEMVLESPRAGALFRICDPAIAATLATLSPYSLILKNVGSVIQTFYLAATDMGLGGCAIGTSNIDLFAKVTKLEFHVEGPVGQFALGRGKKDVIPS
jgi:nitroreductase